MYTAESLRRGTRVGWLILLAAGQIGCNKWQVQSVTPQQTLAERHPSRVRITRRDRTELIVTQPEIVGDSLYGIGRPLPADSAPRRQGFALTDIDRLSIRRTDATATGFLVGGTVAAVTGLGLVILYSLAGSAD